MEVGCKPLPKWGQSKTVPLRKRNKAHILDHLTNARMFYSILFYIDKYAILAFIMVNMWYTYIWMSTWNPDGYKI